MCLHDDVEFLSVTLQPLLDANVPCILFASESAWNGSIGQPERLDDLLPIQGVEVVRGNWPNEEMHRNTAFHWCRDAGYFFMLIPDTDEVIEPGLLTTLLKFAEEDLADVVRCAFDTYWKSPEYVIRPREAIRPAMLVNLASATYRYCREYTGPRSIFLDEHYGVVHHLSYCGDPRRIERKLETWGHKHEVIPGWYERLYKAWDEDKTIRNLHPTHSQAYGFTERIEVPPVLASVPVAKREVIAPDLKKWPTVSIIIPLYGGEEDIANCLGSLEASHDLVSEIIVVDDRSPDNAAEVAERFTKMGKMKVFYNEENRGFAATCNRGYSESSGDVVIFLNSDTIVPRAGLIRLVESLIASGTVGATGPYTNNVGYDQQLTPTYTNIANLNRFAEDFADRKASDVDVTMLVGFCMAIRRLVLDEIGVFDERFGRGMFEDNDLCYRILKAGYKLRIAARSYIHHEGSKSINRSLQHPTVLLKENMRAYYVKWNEEVASGFASHLPGQSGEPIRFRPDRHPDVQQKEIERLAREADISLCMIARDEERVIGECLMSVQHVFREIILVDTGSTDRTREIATELGANVYDHPWPDSFSEARNESLKHAKGKWVFWMDADDTLPKNSALAILRAAISAPEEVNGFVVPVQFVEGGAAGGTRVDHVKLFRNYHSHRFEGRIHEQILPALRRSGGEIARIDAVVLHSGYDTSEAGQAKKRVRDEKLLKLDLAERPDHPFVLFNLGMTDHFCGHHETAVEWLMKSIAAAKNDESHVRKAYALLGVSYRELGHPEEALYHFDKGLEAVGDDPELFFHKAMTLTALGRLEEARDAYLKVGGDTDRYFSSFDTGILGFKKHFNLASVCYQLGRYQEGCQHMRQAVATGAPEAAEGLFFAAMEQGDGRTAGEALEHLRRLTGPTIRWAELGLRQAELRSEDAEHFARRLVSEFPNGEGPRLLLARLLLQNGREHEATPVLDVLDAMGCAEGVYYKGIAAVRAGRPEDALFFFRRAQSIDPGHELTREQIQALEKLLTQESA